MVLQQGALRIRAWQGEGELEHADTSVSGESGPGGAARWLLPAAVFSIPLAYSAAKNLPGGYITFDEDEIVYHGYAEEMARHLWRLEPLQAWQGTTGTYRPPLVQVFDAGAMLAAGPDPFLLSLLRLPWVWILGLLTYLLARDLVRASGAPERARAAGLLAASLTLCSPVVLQLGSTLMSEVPLAASFLLALLALLRSNGFRRPPYVLLLGLACGAGMLIKWTFPVYVAGPLLAETLRGPILGRPGAAPAPTGARSWHPMIGLAVSAGLTFAAMATWYPFAWEQVSSFVFDVSVGDAADDYGATLREGAGEEYGFFLIALLCVVAWLPVALLQLHGALLSLRSAATPFRPALHLALWLPLVGFTLLQNKEVRYILPVVPVLAIAASLGLSLRGGPSRRLGAAVALLLLVQVGGILLPQTMEPQERRSEALGPLRVSWTEDAFAAHLPSGLYIKTPLGALEVWGRQTDFFGYRRPVRAAPVLEEISASLRRLHPTGRRFVAASLFAEPWVWTALWGRALADGDRVLWANAWCDPDLVGEAAFLLVKEPFIPVLSCQEESRASQRRYESLRETVLLTHESWGWEGSAFQLYRDRRMSVEWSDPARSP